MNYIHTDNDFAVEPARGLPALLPRGEFMVWQGAPNWRVFANQVFHTRLIGAFLVLAAAIRISATMAGGGTLGTGLGEASVILAFGLAGLSILWLMAWLVQRTTVYTITNKRVLLRIGVALQKTFNIPFAVMDSAGLKEHGNGTGTISISLKPGTSLAYLILWPHARPWKMAQTQPSLRGIDNAEAVARTLSNAFTSYVQANDALQRSPADVASDAAATATPEGKTKPKDPHAVGKVPLMMAASLVVVTLVTVGIAQLSGGVDSLRSDLSTPAYEQAIKFEPLPGDRIHVVDVATSETIYIVEANSDGLLRGALRGLGRSRALSNLDVAAPYLLQRIEGDGVYLSDELTGRSIRIESFGPILTGAVAVLMNAATNTTN